MHPSYLSIFLGLTPTFRSWFNLVNDPHTMTQEHKMTQCETDGYRRGFLVLLYENETEHQTRKNHGKPLGFQEDFREWCASVSHSLQDKSHAVLFHQGP